MVTRSETSTARATAQGIAAARREMADSIAAHRQRLAARWGAGAAHGRASSRDRAREMLQASKAKARVLLGKPEHAAAAGSTPSPAADLSLEDCHTLELLLSYVRHSVVRVCFYNLKLFCPSLADEYDEEVRGQVAANLAQLPRVRDELEGFFAQTLPGGGVSELFPAQYRDCMDTFGELVRLSDQSGAHLDEEAARTAFAQRVPGLIDAVMAPLGSMQEALDARKIAPADLVRQALDLSSGELERAGIAVQTEIAQVPRVFADERTLLNAVCEVLANAAKYSNSARLMLTVGEAHDDGCWVELVIRDEGVGMAPEELAACRGRGVSNGGTGEGLPMVARLIEQEHLGRLTIDSAPGKGTCVAMRLPVKLEANMLMAQGG